MPYLITGARWHHERYDGRGYPDGLVGTGIPEEARIIAVADAYDAMTSNRSYRRGMDQAKVRQQIKEGKGTQFDPRFADVMLQMIDEDKDYHMREI
jgi:putative two-component system response regulator